MTGKPTAGPLLPDWDDRFPWKQTVGSISTTETLQQADGTNLRVVDATAPTEPTKTDLVTLWKKRSGGGVAPVLLVVRYTVDGQQMATLFGLDEDAIPTPALPFDIATRIVADALNETSPTRLDSEFRRRTESAAGGGATGLRNEGLLATHVLDQVPSGAAWAGLNDVGRPLLGKRGRSLLEGLGYSVEAVPDGTVLREKTGGHRRAAAVLLNDGETFENPLVRLAGSNAVSHGLALARREALDWLVVVGGPVARLYPVSPDVGVGRKGQTQTYVELDLSLLRDDLAGYLPLLLAPEALIKGGYLDTLLDESGRFATGLAERLRDRIYEDVIPGLAVAVAKRFDLDSKTREQQRSLLDEAYHQAMILLFRLLFVAYAEDRGLLPYGKSERYTRNALKTIAKDMVASPTEAFSVDSTTLWDDLTQVWKVIDTGDLEGWGVPPYNGGLFTRDAAKNPSGAATYGLDLTNAEVGPVLRGLLIDVNEDGVLGPVDFRSLSVREFGTIYEGLLESNLGVAEKDLTLAGDDYVPAKKKDPVVVSSGEPYFHSKSGSRKASGSYFTKPFAVEHLLDRALEPALDAHLSRVRGMLDAGKTRDAATALFDFRVTDLSMGSAHFLVAAIDRIEAKFSAFLAANPLPEVLQELDALRAAAAGRLGVDASESGIDDAMLLRRQIARRCIYGIDINEIAVELARLGVWIHTFIPGLPLSFLNHGLMWGNSLTGVGTLDEITDALQEAEERETKSSGAGNSMLLGMALDEFMSRAGEQLDRLGGLADSSIADVAAAAQIQSEIDAALAPLSALCDLITAERSTRSLKKDDPAKIMLSAGGGRLFTVSDAASLEDAVLSHPHLGAARELAASVQAAHLPVLYPEVFRRAPSGFDVILGNPPWEKLHVEEHSWFGLRMPGLRSMSQADRDRAIAQMRKQRPDLVREYEEDVALAAAAASLISAGPYPGIGAAHLDLFAAFCWRFWHEAREGGRIGVVLPRAAFSGSATGDWRLAAIGNAEIDLTTLVNSRQWVFDEVHPQYTIALLAMHKNGGTDVTLRGPFSSPEAYYEGTDPDEPVAAVVPASNVKAWSDTSTIPLVPADVVDIFATMKAHPRFDSRLDGAHFRPIQGDVNATKEKAFFDFNLASPAPKNTFPVWTGGTFTLWEPGSGEPYAFADPKKFLPFLVEKRSSSSRIKSSAFFGMDPKWLDDGNTIPALAPRIAFRDVARATDSRTMICALVPGGIALVHKAPFLLRRSGSAADEAYLLGIMSSIPFDWYARKYVEIAMTFELLNTFPVPRVDLKTGARYAVDGEPLDDTDFSKIRERVVTISGRLAAIDARFSDWAKEVGVKVGSVKSAAERADLLAELDALAALLYGLDRDQVARVFSTFHRGWDFQPRLDSTLAHFDSWSQHVDGGK